MMKTKIKIILFLTVIFLMSCKVKPILNKNEYKVVDTLHVSENGFGAILAYDVIIKYDSTYHYGVIDTKGNLTYVNFRKIVLK